MRVGSTVRHGSSLHWACNSLRPALAALRPLVGVLLLLAVQRIRPHFTHGHSVSSNLSLSQFGNSFRETTFFSGKEKHQQGPAEPAPAALRSRTRTTHWWEPPALCVPLHEGQVGSRSPPTTPRAYLCSVEGPSVPAGSQFLGVAPAPV
jgi:hypothetical protein